MYEMVFALRPNLEEEKIKTIRDGIQNFIEKNDGRVEKFIDIGKKKLAYEAEGEKEGHFTRVFFNVNSAPVKELLRWVKAQEEVIRVAITRKGVDLLKKDIERRKSNVGSE